MGNKWLKKMTCVLGAMLLMAFPMTVSATETVVELSAQDILKATEPRLLVTGYEVTAGKIAQEEGFTLKVDVTNMNKYADAYNVLVTYNSQTDNVRLADGETNQAFWEEVPAGETVSFSMDYEVLSAYVSDTMVMEYTFGYVDRQGVGYTNVSTISPQIDKSCEMQINSLTVAENAVLGSKTLINVRYSGTGALEMKTAKMLIEGNIAGGSKEVELEVSSNGLQKSLDYYVNFEEEGTQDLAISFIYTDENGNEYEVESESFSVEVSKYQTAITNVTQEKTYAFVTEANKYYIVAGCACALMVVLLCVVIGVLKNKKRG
ncbi:MAG: hypothetical protein IJZ82_05210 [Lachnospiraceae bacterium]|nr:hypothetical protein [Lachnospiraceae bacterium]